MKRAAIAWLLLAAGCGPSLGELLPPKHYREALCYARDGSERDRGEVEKALMADADMTLHVHALTLDELRGVLGDAAGAFSASTAVARVRVQTNALPVDGLDVVAAVQSDGTRAEPVTWDSLASVTKEPLPPHRQEKSYATVGNAVAVLTLGLSLLFGVGGDSRTVEVEAPHADYARMAPRATALHDALIRTGCTAVPSAKTEVGRTCEGYFLIDTTRDAPVRLEVAVRYMALREGGKIDDLPRDVEKKRCELTAQRAVPLGRSGAFESGTVALFGKEPRRLAEIGK